MPKFLDAIAGFGVTFATMFKKPVTEKYPEKPGPVANRATTAATNSTGMPTGWRSASAASCARGPARPTPSSSRAPTTPRTNGFRPANVTAASTRSTICGASAAGCASRPAPPVR